MKNIIVYICILSFSSLLSFAEDHDCTVDPKNPCNPCAVDSYEDMTTTEDDDSSSN